MKYCEMCGTELEDNELFCHDCGAKASMPEVIEDTNKFVDGNQRIPIGYQGGYNESLAATDMAVVSYITWIGLVIVLVKSNGEKEGFLNYHLNQSLIAHIMMACIIIPLVGWLISFAGLVCWGIGFAGALTKKEIRIPYISDLRLIK